MSETDQYILESIRNWVWSGFYSADEVDAMIDDILEDDADEDMLRAAVGPEFDRKKKAEEGWPETTDCDRLDAVFESLGKSGVLCLHNAGYTMSDGHSDAVELLDDQPRNRYSGYCFYHGQDVERAVNNGGLFLAFDSVNGSDKLKVGLAVKGQLEAAGFAVEWNGSAETRICIPAFDWKRRFANI